MLSVVRIVHCMADNPQPNNSRTIARTAIPARIRLRSRFARGLLRGPSILVSVELDIWGNHPKVERIEQDRNTFIILSL